MLQVISEIPKRKSQIVIKRFEYIPDSDPAGIQMPGIDEIHQLAMLRLSVQQLKYGLDAVLRRCQIDTHDVFPMRGEMLKVFVDICNIIDANTEGVIA